MKPSQIKLGLEIQLFLMRQGASLEELARQVEMSPDSLSNLIHGHRSFRDTTLEKLADTPLFRQAGFTLARLRSLRAVDEYSFEEIILAMVEHVKAGEIDRLPDDFFERLQSEMERSGFPPTLADKKHALLALIQEDHS